MRLTLETESTINDEEFDELIHTLEYEFSSDYATISTNMEDVSPVYANKPVK